VLEGCKRAAYLDLWQCRTPGTKKNLERHSSRSIQWRVIMDGEGR